MQVLDHVRLGTMNDMEDLVRMSILFHSESPFNNREADDEDVRGLVENLLSRTHQDAIVLVSVDGNRCVGMIAGVATKCLFNKERFSSEVVWWVDKEFRSSTRGKDLVTAYQYWSEHVAKCHMDVMTALADDREKVLGRYYTRQGYYKMETAYLKEY